AAGPPRAPADPGGPGRRAPCGGAPARRSLRRGARSPPRPRRCAAGRAERVRPCEEPPMNDRPSAAIALSLRLTLCTALACLALLVAVPATRAARSRSDPAGRLAPAEARAWLEEIARGLGSRCGAAIVMDPAIVPVERLAPPDAGTSLEAALRSLSRSLPGTAWRRVERTGADSGPLPAPGKLAAAARLLQRLTPGELAVESPETKRTLLFLKDRPLPAAAAHRASAAGSIAPLYLFYSATATDDGRSEAEQIADLERQQLELLA